MAAEVLTMIAPVTELSSTKGEPLIKESTSIEIPPSNLIPLCHPLVEEVTKEVDGYFLEHWPFPNERSRKKFVNAGFSRVTCLYFPKSLDDRIHFACRLLTVLFLIDGTETNR